MGMPAQRHDRRDRHWPMEDMSLRQVGNVARARARRHGGNRAAVERDAAFGRQQAGKGANERGLAGAVWADERSHLTRAQLERGALDDRRAAELHRKLGGVQARGGSRDVHDGDPSSRRRSEKIIARKNGTPISEVTTPTRSSSAAGMARTVMSAAVNSAAPARAPGKSTRAGSEPTARRTRCGATRPTKPIEPAIATEAPTPSATPMTTMRRTRSRLIPSEAAASSPSVSAR